MSTPPTDPAPPRSVPSPTASVGASAPARAGASAPDAPTRRAVLRVVGAVGAGLGAAALSGCGVRRERTAPPIPFLAPRSVDSRAAAAYAELGRVRTARAAAEAGTSGGSYAAVAAVLARLHAQQEGTLTSRLRELGEDPDDTARLDAALAQATPSAAPTGAGAGAAAGSAAPGLAGAEAQGLSAAELAALDRLPRSEAPLLMSLRVQRAVALPLVGGLAPAWATPAIGSETEAARLVGVFRAAEYALGVATARTLGAIRSRLVSPLGWASAVRLVLEPQAGGQSVGVPLGYALPFPVTDDASALRLAQSTLAGVAEGSLSGTSQLAGNAPGLLAVLTLAALAETQAHALGAELRAFPGLRTG